LITGFSRDWLNEDAIKHFMDRQHFGFKPSDFTFAAVRCAVVGLDAIALGQQVHAFVRSEYQKRLECVCGECFA